MSLKSKIRKWWRAFLDALVQDMPEWAERGECPPIPTPAPEQESEVPGPAPEPAPESAPSPAAAAASVASEDGADFSALRWDWGGFDGSKAALADGCRIKGLKVAGSGLSYNWAEGGCERLGASSREDAACIAALFCRVGGAWRGGKFDWISTSRRTRDFKNIFEGYHGWDPDAVRKADAFAFVIISKDGRRRSNVASAVAK